MQTARRMAFGLMATALLWLAAFPVAAAPAEPPIAAGALSPRPVTGEALECTPVIGVDPDPVAFGSVPVGQVALLDVQLQNNDPNGPPCVMTVTSISVTVGATFFDLVGLPSVPFTVVAGSPFTFQVRFSPPQVGPLNGIVTIESDDAQTPVKEVPLSGTGVLENQPPECDANGPYIALVGEAVAFDGSDSSDPDGTIVAYDWQFGDGTTGTGVNPSHTYTAAGNYTATLTVTDDGGAFSSCDADVMIGEVTPDTITVTAPNGGEEFSPGEVTQVTWDRTGEGVPLVDIELSVDGGNTFEVEGVSEENDGSFDWTVPNSPTTQARIRVLDADDGDPSDVSDANFTINGVRVTRPNGGEAFMIGTVEAITWDRFGTAIANVRIEVSTDGGFTFSDIVPSTENDGTFDWTVAGDPTEEGLIRITDVANALATDGSDAFFTLVEPGGNLPPICNADGPYEGLVNEEITFDGTGSSDPDGTIVSYVWDFGDGATGTGAQPTHAYAAAGVYTVSLTVTDDGEASRTCTTAATITEPNVPPVCAAGGPYSGTTGVAITFDGTGSSDPDGTIVSYVWDFGDGATGTGAQPTHAYAAAGDYTVSLTVTDDDDAVSSCSTTASVTEGPNQDPICDADGPYAGTVGVAITFDGTDSSDPDGTIVSYVWDFGDGATATGAQPTHAYAAEGTFSVSLTVTDDDGAAATCTTEATIGLPPTGAVRVALPRRTYASPGEEIEIPIVVLDDVTGLDILSVEFRLFYNPKVLVGNDISFLDTIGEGGTYEWDIEHRSESEDVLRVSVAWTTPLEDCGELVYILFQVTTRSSNMSRLELDFLFNEGTPLAEAHDGEFIKGRLGDVNGSGEITPIDATLILQETIGIIRLPDPSYPYFTVRTADVSGNGSIHAFDAALVLQYVLGIIDRFPAEEDPLTCEDDGRQIASGKPAETRELALEWISPTEAVLVLDDGDGVIGAEASLVFDAAGPSVLEVTAATPAADVLLESRIDAGRVDLATAVARPVAGRTLLARLRFADGVNPADIAIDAPSLNEGLIPVVVATTPLAGVPGAGPVALDQNRPNPFNPATEIRFMVATAGPADLSIFDLSGRRVRSLVQGFVPAGTHTARWDGRDDEGQRVAAGVYIYTLEAAGVSTSRKMILLK